MPSSILWIVAAGLLGAGEILTTRFILGPFAAGALVAGLLVLAGVGTAPAVVVFLVVSLLALVLGRPLAHAQRHAPARAHPRAAELVGRRALVIERIDNGDRAGCVNLDGQAWTARAYHEDEVIDVGARVEVLGFRGVTALVQGRATTARAAAQRSVAVR